MSSQVSLARSADSPEINWQKLLLFGVLLLVGITQAVNMLGFPFYDNVEGTNVARAWSLLQDRSVSPYTYTYDHPPMGWILLAAWIAVSGFVPAPETILPAGRIFMLGTHILTALMIYGVSRKLHLSAPFAILAVVVFCLSPLVTILQRRILLENMMTLWLLVSLYCVLGSSRTLLHYAASALALGIAFLTSVTALSFFPAMLYVVVKQSQSLHRRFALALWLGIVISLFAGFPLHALLKDELFPEGIILGSGHPHVSLYETQAAQLERVSAQEFLRSDSSFVVNFARWTDSDETASGAGLISAGLFSAGLVLIAAITRAHLRPLALLLIFYGLHLITVRQLFDPDIIALLPLLAVSIGFAAQAATRLIEKFTLRHQIHTTLALLLILVSGWAYAQKPEIYTANQVDMQFTAIRWIRQHLPPDALVVTDNYAFVDLRRSIPDTHYYWVVAADPQVREEILEGEWCNIDYMLTTPQMLEDMERGRLLLLLTAHRNSVSMQMYENNGWPIEIRQVHKHNCNIPFP
jgi:4-amino-4-deoxy-L-arabinose transferase-like glycosyltransferase